MKLNCKPGDLAIVVAGRNPENIGKIVTVLRPAIPGKDYTPATSDFSWWVHCPSKLIIKNKYGVLHPPQLEGATRDITLRPVSGLPIDEEVKDEEKEPA